MLKKSQGRAWNIGTRIGIFWKGFQRALSDWDKRSVTWAKSHKLPGWSGHLPVIVVIPVAFVGAFVGGILLLPFIFLSWGASNAFKRTGSDCSSEYDDFDKTGPGYRSGQEGPGYYSGSDDITSERQD